MQIHYYLLIIDNYILKVKYSFLISFFSYEDIIKFIYIKNNFNNEFLTL